jgi:2-polyprenyl-3-methyl-5-hydroxy-6-metoxy-1,4-benzoquinol methylase
MSNPMDAEEPHSSHRSQQADPPAFGSQWWEQHYQGHAAGQGIPSPQLVAEFTGVPGGTALDAGCGNGVDAIWLARQGWEVTAIDISPTAVGRAQRLAADQAPEVAQSISWVVADLTVWDPPKQYDLVVSQYVHPDVPFGDFVARLARAVAPDGTLFVVGHDHADSYSAARAPEKASIGHEAVTASLSKSLWKVDVAETRTLQVRHDSTQVTRHDLVVKAHRKPSR